MEIQIDVKSLSERTKHLLLDFQLAHLHRLIDAAMEMSEPTHLKNYVDTKKAFQKCPEPQIADAGRKLDFEGVCADTDRELERRVEEGLLAPDDFQREFDKRLEARWQDMEKLEEALVRLSLRVKNVMPPFFNQLN